MKQVNILTRFTYTYLLDFMVRSVPMVRINSLKDLSHRQDMKIITRADNSLAVSLEKGDSTMGKTLFSQLDTYKFF